MNWNDTYGKMANPVDSSLINEPVNLYNMTMGIMAKGADDIKEAEDFLMWIREEAVRKFGPDRVTGNIGLATEARLTLLKDNPRHPYLSKMSQKKLVLVKP